MPPTIQPPLPIPIIVIDAPGEHPVLPTVTYHGLALQDDGYSCGYWAHGIYDFLQEGHTLSELDNTEATTFITDHAQQYAQQATQPPQSGSLIQPLVPIGAQLLVLFLAGMASILSASEQHIDF